MLDPGQPYGGLPTARLGHFLRPHKAAPRRLASSPACPATAPADAACSATVSRANTATCSASLHTIAARSLISSTGSPTSTFENGKATVTRGLPVLTTGRRPWAASPSAPARSRAPVPTAVHCRCCPAMEPASSAEPEPARANVPCIRSGLPRRERDGRQPNSWLDVGTSGLRDPQPVQREEGYQRMLERRTEPRGDQHGAQLVAV
jgi:hypothetical protein